VIIVRTADAIIAIDGRYGTLSEIAHALDQGKKIISLRSWSLLEIGVEKELFVEATTPEDAVKFAFEYTKSNE